MALLTRLFTFLPNTLIKSSEVNSELNQLVNILSGISTDKDALIKYNHVTDPALRVDQLGAGIIQRWLQNGVDKARIRNDGSFQTAGSAIFDNNGNELIKLTSNALAVNELNITNQPTGSNPAIAPTGDDVNIGINISPKGTGTVKIASVSTSSIPLTIDTPLNPTTNLAQFKNNGTIKALVDNNGSLVSNTSVALAAANLLVINHAAVAPQTAVVASVKAGTAQRPLDVVGENAGAAGLFRAYEDGDATERSRISNDGKIETRAGNGATPSTSFITLAGLYHRNFTTAGNVGVAETDLHSKTLEANVLGEDGDTIEATFAGTFANNANNKTWKVYFGGTQLAGAASTAYSNQAWVIYVTIIRVSSTTVKCIIHHEVQSNIVNSIVTYVSVGALSFTGTLILKVTGQSAVGSNDVVQEMTVVKKYSSQ